jgi:ABC-type branched-subunit amino acid transport system substrate-binding protein
MRGVKDAIEYFKIKNPNIEVTLVAEDSQGDPNQAVSAATKLATIDQVGFSVIGTSAVSAAVAPIADQYKKIFISDAAMYGLTKDKQYMFQNFMPALGGVATQINANDKWKKVGIIYINDDFGKVWSEKIKNGLQAGKMAELFSFEKTTTDFKTDALKVKKSNPDTLVIIGYGPALNQVLADLKLNEVKKPIIGYLSCTLPGVLDDKRFSLEGQYSYEYPEISNEEVKTWILSKGGEMNTFYTAAFDNTLLALNAAKDSNNDPEKALSLIQNGQYDGLWGKINFAGANTLERDLVLTQITNGKCVSIK